MKNRYTDTDRARCLANLPRPDYPEELPVVVKRAEIARAIKENQVVIVCGETGSGRRSAESYVKVMTDDILLAETQRDPLLALAASFSCCC